MIQYLEILQKILTKGDKVLDRTGTGTLSIFGTQTRYDLSRGQFPLLTTKKVFFKGIVEELLWFLRGSTNVKELQEKGVHIWDEWADPNGDLGPIYGYQWRSWGGDQIKEAIRLIKEEPSSRRIIVSSWNVPDLPKMALPPCHTLFQFHVREPYLDLQLYQRSADWFLGVPFNIASYSLLLILVAGVTGYKPGEFIHTTGDTHLYLNHIEQAEEQLTRKPRSLPSIKINKRKDIFDYRASDISLKAYDPYPAIKVPISV